MLEVEPNSITTEEALVDIEEWNSLAVISFIAMIDELFGIAVLPQKISEAVTVKDLITLLGEAIDD